MRSLLIFVLLLLSGCSSTTTPQPTKADTQQVIASGIGASSSEALSNALQNAIQHYVGVVVDSDTQIEQERLIRDQILLASNGYIKTYKVLSRSSDDGLFEVKVQALVKQQVLDAKLHQLNLSQHAPEQVEQAEQRIKTKVRSKAQIMAVINHAIADLFSLEGAEQLLQANIDQVTLLEDKADSHSVPIKIDFSYGINADAYKSKLAQLEQQFAALNLPHYPALLSPGLNSRKSISLNKLDRDGHYFYVINERQRENLFGQMGPLTQADMWQLPDAIDWQQLPYQALTQRRKSTPLELIVTLQGSQGPLLQQQVPVKLGMLQRTLNVYGTGRPNPISVKLLGFHPNGLGVTASRYVNGWQPTPKYKPGQILSINGIEPLMFNFRHVPQPKYWAAKSQSIIVKLPLDQIDQIREYQLALKLTPLKKRR
ncbi:hypothetical protein [uncultured Ferrimonas sp.]|uniref:hypothetical protein n=1 Tax=uncultured Ferrimonas sp. TaxID=432640 RepID=UPI0026180E6C|nr:hypothetical protein [uncultured Ferrimonas sp.]